LQISQGLARVQVDVRVELIPMNLFQIPLEEAVTIALENRTDLMNQRAFVMDARRKVEVAANQLQAMLDIVATGDLRTPSIAQLNNNPVDFRADLSDYRVGISFTTPIQLVRERNIYRAALIDYQRARRLSMRAEDQVKFDVRTAWRQLTILRQNFENAKYATRVAALLYDQTAEQTNAPARPGAGGGGAGGGAGAGNQGLQLINAFNSILQAQNNLIGIWVNFETNRLNIYRDMGIMEIDERGVWIDNYYIDRVNESGGVLLPELRAVDSPYIVPPGTQPNAGLPVGPVYQQVTPGADAELGLPPQNLLPQNLRLQPGAQPLEPDDGLRRRILFPDRRDPLQPVIPDGVPPRPAESAVRPRRERRSTAGVRPTERAALAAEPDSKVPGSARVVQ